MKTLKVTNELKGRTQSQFLATVQISQDSIRSSRGDMIRAIMRNGSDVSGFSGTLGASVARVLLLTYGVGVLDYIGINAFFDPGAAREIYGDQIVTAKDIKEAVNAIHTNTAKKDRNNKWPISISIC